MSDELRKRAEALAGPHLNRTADGRWGHACAATFPFPEPCSCGQAQRVEAILKLMEEVESRMTAREWADLAISDGRYLPHHSVLWLVVNGKVCRKHHTDFINDPCIFEEMGFSGDRDAWKWKAEAAEAKLQIANDGLKATADHRARVEAELAQSEAKVRELEAALKQTMNDYCEAIRLKTLANENMQKRYDEGRKAGLEEGRNEMEGNIQRQRLLIIELEQALARKKGA